MTNQFKRNFILNTIFYSITAILFFLMIRFLLVYLFPVIIGIVVTIIVQKPACFISDKVKIKKGYCALVLVILSYALIIGLCSFLIIKGGYYISGLFNESSGIINSVNDAVKKLSLRINEIVDTLPSWVSGFLENTVSKIAAGLSGYISDFAKNTAKATPMFLTGSIVTIIASCYIARDFEGFKASLKSILSRRILDAYYVTKRLFKENVSKLIAGYLKILLITFFELLIGLFILKIKPAILLAAIIALLDLLPILGTGTVLIPWGIFEMVSKNYQLGFSLIILYLTITIIRNVIEPKIIGKQIGLHPLIALIAVFLGLRLFGFIGVFILPLTFMLIYRMYEAGVFEILFSNKNRPLI